MKTTITIFYVYHCLLFQCKSNFDILLSTVYVLYNKVSLCKFICKFVINF